MFLKVIALSTDKKVPVLFTYTQYFPVELLSDKICQPIAAWSIKTAIFPAELMNSIEKGFKCDVPFMREDSDDEREKVGLLQKFGFNKKKAAQKYREIHAQDLRNVMVLNEYRHNAEMIAQQLVDKYKYIIPVVTNDAEDALRMLKNRRFDLVIANYAMGKMNPLKFLGEIRKGFSNGNGRSRRARRSGS